MQGRIVSALPWELNDGVMETAAPRPRGVMTSARPR